MSFDPTSLDVNKTEWDDIPQALGLRAEGDVMKGLWQPRVSMAGRGPGRRPSLAPFLHDPPAGAGYCRSM